MRRAVGHSRTGLPGGRLQALARSAYPEAVACFDQALAALRCLPQREYQETCEQVITILFGLRGALVQLGDLERALVVLQEAETLARTLDDPHQLGRVSSYGALLLSDG